MAGTRKVCVFTGTRAEYGLLQGLMAGIRDSARLELQVLVAGMHLSPAFGETWREVEADGFPIDARAEILVSGDSPTAVATSMGLGVMKVADALARLRPDILVLLGDRFEALAAAQAAMLCRVPIAHIHGGEATEGLIDEAIRHSITKMSHLHFAAAEPFRRRIVQLGEQPDRVFDVGAPGIDNLRQMELMDRAALEASLGFDLTPPLLLVTYHPVTLSDRPATEPLGELLEAFRRMPECRVLLTRSNADPGGLGINDMLDRFAAEVGERVRVSASLGQVRYLSAMALADAVVGNSSSGIIEAPAAGTPTVNLGERQAGRPRAPSVLDVAEEADAIEAAIRRALSPAFQELAARRETPFGSGGAAARMVEVLEEAALDGILFKRFHDLPGGPA